MALQLKNKAKEENTEKESGKKGKYKRKRNVFGKRLTRFGLIGTIVGLAVAFAIVKTVFTLNQNKKQAKINQNLNDVEAKIKEYRKELSKKSDTYENVGKLIATLPISFDRQATSLDLDRMIILSGLTESTTTTRKISEANAMPIECSVSTVKAVQIQMTVNGEVDNIEPILKLINYLCDYSHENFYYISSVSYSEDRTVFKRSQTTLTLYTFYNDVDIAPETPANNTDTKTNTQTK